MLRGDVWCVSLHYFVAIICSYSLTAQLHANFITIAIECFDGFRRLARRNYHVVSHRESERANKEGVEDCRSSKLIWAVCVVCTSTNRWMTVTRRAGHDIKVVWHTIRKLIMAENGADFVSRCVLFKRQLNALAHAARSRASLLIHTVVVHCESKKHAIRYPFLTFTNLNRVLNCFQCWPVNYCNKI